MGIETALILGAAGLSAASSISQGDAAKEEARKNALLLKEKGLMIGIQQDLEAQQYDRLSSRTYGSTLANAAASGLGPGGSVMAVLLDTQKQIALDKAVGQVELETSKRFTQAEADAEIRQGRIKQRAGYYNAFSSLLKGGAGALDLSSGSLRAA